jgi:hypothetical protein
MAESDQVERPPARNRPAAVNHREWSGETPDQACGTQALPNPNKTVATVPGSTRVSRVAFGVPPKASPSARRPVIASLAARWLEIRGQT